MTPDLRSSRIPPRLIRHKFAAQRVGDRCPRLVLPTPGGPRKERIAPCPCAVKFSHGEIFDQPFLNFLQIVVGRDRGLAAPDSRSRLSLLNLFHGRSAMISM